MESLLMERNHQLSRDITNILRLIDVTEIPEELENFRRVIVQVCKQLRGIVEQNRIYLERGYFEILEDILSDTKVVSENISALSIYYLPPILRSKNMDQLGLQIINWLHQEHNITKDYPAVFGSGSFSILPYQVINPIYFIPSLEQRRLLFIPLLFHEFGHLLYVCHKPEMDDLVAELRQDIVAFLSPVSQRNDRFSEEQKRNRKRIATTWYSWAQELFCDAVGLVIGGPCFLNAFSFYLNRLSKIDYYREPKELELSGHPVTWLRVRFLTDRAIQLGFKKEAGLIQNQWLTIANLLNAKEDYHGYYHASLKNSVSRTVDDMVIETAPRECDYDEAYPITVQISDNPIKQLNYAWKNYLNSPNLYEQWESHYITKLIEH